MHYISKALFKILKDACIFFNLFAYFRAVNVSLHVYSSNFCPLCKCAYVYLESPHEENPLELSSFAFFPSQ